VLNIIWGSMLVVAIVYGIFLGDIESLNEAFLDSSSEAVSLCITMLGIMSFWMGIMEIARKGGVLVHLAKFMKPLLVKIFPGIRDNDKALEYIAANFAANIMGLGWAATPLGLKAMKELKKCNNREDGVASDEMCSFLVINISSLQLVPVTIIAYRNQYGSVNPTSIIGPAIIVSGISTIVAIIFCLIMTGRGAGK